MRAVTIAVASRRAATPMAVSYTHLRHQQSEEHKTRGWSTQREPPWNKLGRDQVPESPD